MSNKQIQSIERYLEDFGNKGYNPKDWRKYLAKCINLKENYIYSKDFKNANVCLLLESVIHIHHKYLKSYKLIAKDQQEKAWSLIIDIENLIDRIKPYLLKEFSKYKIDIIEDKNKKIQTLFPYTHFFITGFSVKSYKCSICGETISMRNRCKHKTGHIYNGRWCVWKAVDMTNFDHVAIVENPKDKRCIITNFEGNRLNFSIVNALINNINKPYLNWDLKWSKLRHPHKFFKDVKESDTCPCGSGLTYNDCCMKESGVLRPHVDFDFGEGFCTKSKAVKYCYSKPKLPKKEKEHVMSGVILAN